MYIDSTLYEGRPHDKRIEKEEACYDFLDRLDIKYYRVDHERADTIEACEDVEKILRRGIGAERGAVPVEFLLEQRFERRHDVDKHVAKEHHGGYENKCGPTSCRTVIEFLLQCCCHISNDN